MRILLITKIPALLRYEEQALRRLDEQGVVSRQQLEQAQRRHFVALDHVRDLLHPFQVCERRVDELMPEDGSDCDAVVTVGGDGTLLAANSLITSQPVIAVNSDPQSSIGELTRCTADTFADVLVRFQDGTTDEDRLPRLSLSLDEQLEHHPILNDCLFTNQNPAAMTRYRIEVDDSSEDQDSSGVWVSTAAGSTGGIHSAGMPSVPADVATLLYMVREPFCRRCVPQITSGEQRPPETIRLTALMPGIYCYIDGAHIARPVPAGATAIIGPSTNALILRR